MTLDQQLDLATGLILSYHFDGATDKDMPKIFGLLGELCPDAHYHITVFVLAIQDPRFNEYGAADAGEALRRFDATGNLGHDVEAFLVLLKRAEESAVLEAKGVMATNDEYRQMAREFVDQFGLNATREDLAGFLAER